MNKPKDVNVCQANVSYNVKSIPKRKFCWQGTSSHFYNLKNLAAKKHNSQQYGGEGIERDEQRRDNFQFGGKDELNLKLTVFFTAVFFFRNLELSNPGINLLKIFGILNGVAVWIHHPRV